MVVVVVVVVVQVVPARCVEFEAGMEVLSVYTFGTGAAKHMFCSVCGTPARHAASSAPAPSCSCVCVACVRCARRASAECTTSHADVLGSECAVCGAGNHSQAHGTQRSVAALRVWRTCV